MSKKLIIFGAGQIAEVAHYYLSHDSNHEIAGFSVNAQYIKENTFCGLPVFPFEEIEQSHRPADHLFFAPVGYGRVNQERKRIYDQIESKGYQFATYIHSKAMCAAKSVGKNCFILENNVIQPFVTIGDNVILWSGNHIGHHSHIGNHCFVASHVVVSGAVSIGDYAFLGVNATIRDNVKIGERSVIGAGAVVLSDIPEDSVLRATATEIARTKGHQLKSI